MAQAGLIGDPVLWFEYIEARNLSSHTYKEELAERVYKVASEFFPNAMRLLEELKKL